jgi:hypothetical protein
MLVQKYNPQTCTKTSPLLHPRSKPRSTHATRQAKPTLKPGPQPTPTRTPARRYPTPTSATNRCRHHRYGTYPRRSLARREALDLGSALRRWLHALTRGVLFRPRSRPRFRLLCSTVYRDSACWVVLYFGSCVGLNCIELGWIELD